MTTIAIIGLDGELTETLRKEVSPLCRVLIYDTVPRGYADVGRFYVEHPTMMDTWIAPDAVIYYSYFENALAFRKAIALSGVPSFPNVGATILHDDKELSLIYRSNVASAPPFKRRGYVPAGVGVTFPESRVVKQGNGHCGENKFRIPRSSLFAPDVDSMLETFHEGKSYRVLVIGDQTWTILYESEDWRKNVGGTQTLIPRKGDVPNPFEPLYAAHAKELGLAVAGFDFIRGEDKDLHDLEVNCYPGIPPFAEKAFLEEAVSFLRSVL
jgi:hypothetical protein